MIYLFIKKPIQLVKKNILIICLCISLYGCGISYHAYQLTIKKISHIKGSEGAQIGVFVYNETRHNIWYQYQADKLFLPASNMKIISLLAGLLYLPDSIPSIHYCLSNDTCYFTGEGDPTLLHPDFSYQPIIDFLHKQTHLVYCISPSLIPDMGYAPGWSWDDYQEYYMPERSLLPIYGNVIRWISPYYSTPQIKHNPSFSSVLVSPTAIGIHRLYHYNTFEISDTPFTHPISIPFITNKDHINISFLSDTLHMPIDIKDKAINTEQGSILYTRPIDSLYQIMLKRSDNFYAEQVLEMIHATRFPYSNMTTMFDSLKNILQLTNIRWVDGSGLSRYNLITPINLAHAVIQLLHTKGYDTMTFFFPSPAKGDDRFLKPLTFPIFAKTGSMSGVRNLTGFLLNKHRQVIVFSILINNFIHIDMQQIGNLYQDFFNYLYKHS